MFRILYKVELAEPIQPTLAQCCLISYWDTRFPTSIFDYWRARLKRYFHTPIRSAFVGGSSPLRALSRWVVQPSTQPRLFSSSPVHNVHSSFTISSLTMNATKILVGRRRQHSGNEGTLLHYALAAATFELPVNHGPYTVE